MFFAAALVLLADPAPRIERVELKPNYDSVSLTAKVGSKIGIGSSDGTSFLAVLGTEEAPGVFLYPADDKSARWVFGSVVTGQYKIVCFSPGSSKVTYVTVNVADSPTPPPVPPPVPPPDIDDDFIGALRKAYAKDKELGNARNLQQLVALFDEFAKMPVERSGSAYRYRSVGQIASVIVGSISSLMGDDLPETRKACIDEISKKYTHDLDMTQRIREEFSRDIKNIAEALRKIQ